MSQLMINTRAWIMWPTTNQKTAKVQQRNNEPNVKGSTAPIHERQYNMTWLHVQLKLSLVQYDSQLHNQINSLIHCCHRNKLNSLLNRYCHMNCKSENKARTNSKKHAYVWDQSEVYKCLRFQVIQSCDLVLSFL